MCTVTTAVTATRKFCCSDFSFQALSSSLWLLFSCYCHTNKKSDHNPGEGRVLLLFNFQFSVIHWQSRTNCATELVWLRVLTQQFSVAFTNSLKAKPEAGLDHAVWRYNYKTVKVTSDRYQTRDNGLLRCLITHPDNLWCVVWTIDCITAVLTV